MISVGDEVVVKATKAFGVAELSNGHSPLPHMRQDLTPARCKLGDRWYHIDELEAPRRSLVL